LQERALIYRSPPGSAAWHVVGVVSIGALLRQLDASIVSLLFPTLETTFHRPVSSVSWVAVTYRLTLATLVAVFGRLADLYGRKMLYTFGFLVFIAGSAVYQAWGQVTDRAPSRPPPGAPLVDEALRRPGPPQLSYIRLGLEVLQAADLRFVVRHLVQSLAAYLRPWLPPWSPSQLRYRFLSWWTDPF
jgi:MFS family permease